MISLLRGVSLEELNDGRLEVVIDCGHMILKEVILLTCRVI